MTEKLDPVDILNRLADACPRSADAAFWVLASAAAHLNGYDLHDGEGSSAEACLAWMERKRRKREKSLERKF